MTLSFYQHAKSQTSKSKIGAQAHQLTTLLDAGFPVPKGFLVAADTCRAFFMHGRLQDKIKMLLERCNYHDPEDLMRVSRNIQKLIMSAEMPQEAANSLLEAAIKVSSERVMLTASPVGNTAPGVQHHTDRIYGIEGEANILLSIRQLWASQFRPDDLYFIYTTEDHEFPCMAICVQVQPRAIASGILYTTDTHEKHSCMIQTIWGEGAYQHKLQGADTYHIHKDTGNEQDSLRSMQTHEYTWSNGELERLLVPESRQKKQKLSQSVLQSLGELARDVQQKLFYPQEVTFVYDGKKVYLISTHQSSMIEEVAPIPQPSEQTKRVLLKGVGASPGIITGMVRVVRGPSDKDSQPGDIVVARSLSHIASSVLRNARGVIVEEETHVSALMDVAQKGVAFLMSAAGAVDLLEPGSFVTLHTPRGVVLAGGYAGQLRIPEEHVASAQSATRIGTALSLGNPTNLATGTLRGHILLSPHKLIKQVGIHPLKLVREHKTRILSDHLAGALAHTAAHFTQEPFLFAFSHFTTDEYASLSGGESYETLEERNPLMGYMGCTRILQTPDLLAPEFEAITSVRKQVYGKRISLLIPACRTSHEIRSFEELLSQRGLSRNASCRHFVDLSIPSLLYDLESASHLIDGIVLNVNALYTHLFAHDPSSDAIRLHTLDFQEPLLALIKLARETCAAQGIQLILRGSLLEHDAFLSYIVRSGIHEILVPESMISMARERIIALEQEHITHV